MKYVSTRNKNVFLSASETIAQGLADDGGLLTPEVFPKLTPEMLEDLRGKTYAQRAVAVMKLFLDNFSEEELTSFTEAGYASTKFDDPKVAPLHPLNDDTYCLELWHGPTSAFKDMALQILPHLLSASLVKNNEKKTVCILVATSGDTGKAALEGFKDVKGTKILVFYPKDGVSKVQALQMQTQEGGNVGVCAVHGNFDDAQTGVKTPLLRRASAGRSGKAGLLPVLCQLHQLGPDPAAAGLLHLRLLRPAEPGQDPDGREGQLLRAHRQLRQHPGRLLRRADGPARGQAHLRLQQQQRADRLPGYRHL